MLCPDDISALKTQNSKGSDLQEFSIDFVVCGGKPGCLSGIEDFQKFNKYFRKFYFKIKYLGKEIDMGAFG